MPKSIFRLFLVSIFILASCTKNSSTGVAPAGGMAFDPDNLDENGVPIVTLSAGSESGRGLVNSSDSSVDFGNSSLARIDRTITLTNSGTSAISDIAFTGTRAAFHFTGTGVAPGEGGTCATTLNNASQCTISLSFWPLLAGAYGQAGFRMTYTYLGRSRALRIPLTGTGLTTWTCVRGAAGFAGGNGSLGNPFVVSTPAHLRNVACNRTKAFVQANDIDMDGEFFMKLGNLTSPFTGVYDGADHTISNLHLVLPDHNAVGLFGATNGATITGVRIVNATAVGKSRVGLLVGEAAGSTITRNSSSGSATALWFDSGAQLTAVGGLIGFSDGSSVSRCSSSATVQGLDPVSSGHGGLIGEVRWGTINDNFATGNVSGYDSTGGLFGHLHYWSTMSNGYSTGTVSGTHRVGGLTGYNPADSSIASSYWDTETSGASTTVRLGTGLTTAEMKDQSSFVGWDFSTVWSITPGNYPVLR